MPNHLERVFLNPAHRAIVLPLLIHDRYRFFALLPQLVLLYLEPADLAGGGDDVGALLADATVQKTLVLRSRLIELRCVRSCILCYLWGIVRRSRRG
jgi:hypothetical protein